MKNRKMVSGMVKVLLICADGGQVLSALSENGIDIQDIQSTDRLSFAFTINKRLLRKCEAIAKKHGGVLKIIQSTDGWIPLLLSQNRPVLMFGILILFLLVWLLPTRILFVNVEGNHLVPDKQILEAAEKCGVGFWGKRTEIRSEKIKNNLLSAIPELQWAGINTRGCTATISVREKHVEAPEVNENQVTKIVAARDAYLLSGTVTRGTALYQVGQTVRTGETLVSGYTDCGIFIQGTRAEGEIWGQTKRDLQVVIPAQYLKKYDSGSSYKKISLQCGKKRIFLWKDSRIPEGGCGRIYKEYDLALPGNYRLPITLCVEEYGNPELVPCDIPQEEAERILIAYASDLLTQQMIAGSIQDKEESVVSGKDIFILKGTYSCTEMIGREEPELIGEENGKNN